MCWTMLNEMAVEVSCFYWSTSICPFIDKYEAWNYISLTWIILWAFQNVTRYSFSKQTVRIRDIIFMHANYDSICYSMHSFDIFISVSPLVRDVVFCNLQYNLRLFCSVALLPFMEDRMSSSERTDLLFLIWKESCKNRYVKLLKHYVECICTGSISMINDNLCKQCSYLSKCILNSSSLERPCNLVT